MLPLHAACASGNEPAIRALLEAYPQGASSGRARPACSRTTARRERAASARSACWWPRTPTERLHEEDDDGLLPIDATDIRTVEVATAVW